jgi:hypothetical protein
MGAKMKKYLFLALLCMLILSACAKSPEVTATPDSSSTSETQLSPTTLPPLPIYGILKESTVLYSLPLNNDYYALGELSKGTEVDLSGWFGDFVSIETSANGKILQGYVLKMVLEDVPSELKELAVEEVAWQQIPFLFGFMYNQDLDIVGLAENEVSINNPLPNTYEIKGAPIRVESAFRITASFEAGDTNLSSIQLKGFKPNPSSPTYRLDIASFQGKVMLLFRDGSQELPTSIVKTELRSDQSFSVVFSDPSAKIVQLYDGNHNLVTTVDVIRLPDSNFPDGLFPNQRFYLGATCSNASKVTISSFTLEEAPTGKMMEPPQIGLKSFAESHGISMGNVLEVNILDNDKYIEILQKDFGLLDISEFSAAYLQFWRGPGDYNWAVIDPVVEYALQNGHQLRANHLTMGDKSSIPQWLLESNYSRDEYIRILETYIKDVVTHYKGKITEYSIANEAINRSFAPGGDFWNDKIGPEYIEMAFRWAREADPNAILILNEIDNEDPRDERSRMITEKMYLTVKDLIASSCPRNHYS